MKGILMTFCILLFGTSLLSQEIIYTEVSGDTVVIHHDRVERNCGALYRTDHEFEDPYTINVYEVDTGLCAYCICFFDLSLTLHRLAQGTYTVGIYHIENEMVGEDTIYCGSTSFTITNGLTQPEKLLDSQSDCYYETNTENITEGKITICPNPASSFFSIHSDKFTRGTLYLYDISGTIIMRRNFQTEELFNIKNLKTGIYFYKIQTKEKVFQGRLLKK